LDHVQARARGIALDAGLSEIARFLPQRPPFAALAPDELGDLVAGTEIEFYATGAVILSEDGGPVTFLRVIHSGGVDIAHDGRLLDLLGPGDTFGHAAMLSGLPPGFEARAAEDTLCYRIPVAAARPILERARSRELAVGLREPGHQAVAELIRAPTVRCDPSAPIGETARRMTEAGANSAIVDLPDGGFGILTDRDLRTRVVAAGVPSTAAVAEVMSTPVFTVTPGRLGGEVLFEMLERGIRHAPVVTEAGRLIGVVEDADLLALQPRSWFGARGAIARAEDIASLAEVARRLPSILLDLHQSNLRALDVARVLSALVDALTTRSLELARRVAELPDEGLVWVAVGSHARRELTPASTACGVVVCSEPPPPAWIEAAGAALRACGLQRQVIARAAHEWLEAGGEDELALAVLADRRVLFGAPREALTLADGADRDALLAVLARRALASLPPTGFDAGGVLESGGARSERLDIRRAALRPIAAITRWAGAAAGLTDGSTPERLRVAAERGVLSAADAATLADSFELVFELRVGHHLERLAADLPPDDLVDPATMSPLARDHLRDVFRAIAGVQRRLRA
jgi:CBS domain-containing protein